jgi:hypothetical protein
MASVLVLAGGCEPTSSTANKEIPNPITARSISSHYTMVEFDGSVVGTAAAEPESYVIVGPGDESLAVLALDVSDDGTEVMLTTEEQDEVPYDLTVAGLSLDEALRGLAAGSIGFVGTSMREPFLESAVSLSSTQILLTFSNQMDQATTENIDYYEIADPDGNTDIDIRITGATLQPDLTTVILETTPQANIEYTIRVTNVQRRFTCDDEGRIFLSDAAQGTSCAGNFRPTDPEGVLSSFVLTSRTQIDRNAPLDPYATGVGASVGLEANGAGVRRPLCNGGTTGIDGGNGSDPDEELIFTADRAELAENVVLGVRELDFTVDAPVLFISSEDADGFDIVIGTAEIQAAFNTGVEAGDIVFANLTSLPAGLKIDAIKLRETEDEIWVHSVCGLAINRRLIDPTRNTASFFGIPAPDDTGPFVVSARSVSDTEVIVSFSEPLNSDAPDPLHFSISPELVVTNAVLTKYDTQVILTTTPQRVDVVYTVTVSDVFDKAGNIIGTPDSATFGFVGGPASLGADSLPRVAGAVSTSNTTVTVTFTKPMGPSAEVASNYIIVQENVNAEVGAIGVLSAAFLTPQADAVELTTTAQSEVTYFLSVTNVRDLSGNQIAPPELLVDPSTAIFAGSPFACRPACTNGYVDPDSGSDLCVTDDDCTADDECQQGDSCEGACSPCDVPDSDGDGIPDAVEQRGWVVVIGLANGEFELREVTSDPFSRDTDGDQLDDQTELRIVSDPRRPDTDGDSLSDEVEWNVTFSSPTDEDSDEDGIDDGSEVDFFKTNANLADSDGDGFTDSEELFEMNRDPRISDLPEPRIQIGTVDLHLDEAFTFVDERGITETTESSTATSLSAEQTRSTSLSVGSELGFGISAGLVAGIDGGFTNVTVLGNVGVDLNFGVSFQASLESSQTTTSAFETSLAKGLSLTGSRSTTREIVGARIDALVTLENASDVAFSLSNLEITVLAPDQIDRTSLVPVATLVPNSTLVTGEPAVYNMGVLDGGRGPIMFSSLDVFPSTVEGLMRDPRGLVFEFANFDLTDEFERNFAFASQMARDRTVGILVDFGDGDTERFLVATSPVRNNAGDIVGGFANFEGTGPPPSLPLEYILEEVLGFRRGVVEVTTPIWEGLEFVENEPGGAAVAFDGILAGRNGVSDSIAQGDDVQRIPFGIDGLPEDVVVIDAGENGILESQNRDANNDGDADDVEAVITGYATSGTCGPDTPSTIRPGPDGVVDTIRDPFSDDEQLVPNGTDILGDPGTYPDGLATDIIGPGTNGFIDTAPVGDDIFVGPGIPCDDAADCPDNSACDGQETLFRFDRRTRGQFGRVWAVLLPNSDLLGVDFRRTSLRAGDLLRLGFIQDLDRDGLISDVEFLFGSSDTRQDTDGDQLDDFSEIRVGWEVGVDGEPLRQVFPDPRQADSDRDGLNDREEQDFRRVQCACQDTSMLPSVVIGEACTSGDDCSGGDECVNIARESLGGGAFRPCSTVVTSNRLDPRRVDTDGDTVTDSEEVLGWLTQAAIIDPSDVIVAGPDRQADAVACPNDVCAGGADNDEPCRFARDCRPLKVCTNGPNKNQPCDNDIECIGPSPELTGLCEEAVTACNGGSNDGDPCQDAMDCSGGACETPADLTTLSGRCNRSDCDDVQVVEPGTVGLDENTVVVAPGRFAGLDSSSTGSVTLCDPSVANDCDPGEDADILTGDLRAESSSRGDDAQIALVDDSNVLENTPIGRVIIRPGVNGLLETLPNNADAEDGNPNDGDDVIAFGQFMQTTDPLKADTDQDQISDGFERLLGSDPRNSADGGLLGDKDGDGLTDIQEQSSGWIVRVEGQADLTVYSNPNVADSDLDGLPDFAESLIRSDPNNVDTDGDGLTDFDEVSDEQFDEFERFNDIFPGYFVDRSTSAIYGTDPMDCDSDDDFLLDDFEVLTGFAVTVPTPDGIAEVRQGFTDPTNADTDFDGLSDGEELLHDLTNPPDCENDADCIGGACIGFSPCTTNDDCNKGICANSFCTVGSCTGGATDPTDFDSDDDGKPDGVECQTLAATPALCEVFSGLPQLAECGSNPLSADKKVTVRYVQMTLERGDPDGLFDLVDIDWRFQAQKSDEGYPGSWSGVVGPASGTDCPGIYLEQCAGGLCELNIGQDIVFNTKACNGGTSNNDPCNDDSDCPDGTCQPGANEKIFSLRPGQGILLNGAVNEYDNCTPAICNGGPNDFVLDLTSGLVIDYTECTDNDIEETCLCPGTCAGGANDGSDCEGADPDCEQITNSNCCTDNGASSPGCDDSTCETDVCAVDPYCCDTSWDSICANQAVDICPALCAPGTCQAFDCGGAGITCATIDKVANHVTYFKTLSYETLQDGFSTDIVSLNDAAGGMDSAADSLSVKLVVEIIVE